MFIKTGAASVGLISVAVLVLLSEPATAQTTLKYKFKEGDKLNYATDMTQKQTMNIMGMEIETVTTQKMDMTWNVQEVKDGKAQIAQTIDRVRMKVDSPAGGFEFDSKDGKEPEGQIGMIVGPMLSAMAGAEFTVTMTEHGEITKTKLSEKLLEAMKSNPFLQQMGFSEEGMKNMLGQQGGSVLPKEPVKKGDTWNQKLELKMPPIGVTKMNNTYTYQGPEERDGAKVERIDVKTEMTIEPLPDAAVQIEFKVKSSDVKGAMYFDNKTGRLVGTTMNTKMAMEINAMGNVIDMVQDQTMTVKLVQEPKSGD